MKWFQRQLVAFRARRFEQLDVEPLGDELEARLGTYRGEIRERAQHMIQVLMRPKIVYGDWQDLRLEWELLESALEDSPSLVRTAAAEIKRAYERARLGAELHCERRWPKRCPWPTLKALIRAVRVRDRQCIALERAGDPDFMCVGLGSRVSSRSRDRRRQTPHSRRDRTSR